MVINMTIERRVPSPAEALIAVWRPALAVHVREARPAYTTLPSTVFTTAATPAAGLKAALTQGHKVSGNGFVGAMRADNDLVSGVPPRGRPV
ncbi:hypothetical protein [Pilimelia columellifera]|uniref:Uncharacterized protein n=1 Tax=Pilimelia columellifera subsp. columellifera TaxID=706583 RepID=A0ABP6ADW4_9ACTN